MGPPEDTHKNIHSSFVHNSSNLRTSQISTKRRMENCGLCINEMPHSNYYVYMDESHGCYIEQKKSDTKKFFYVLCDFIYISFKYMYNNLYIIYLFQIYTIHHLQ